jgi:hypothetical protein
MRRRPAGPSPQWQASAARSSYRGRWRLDTPARRVRGCRARDPRAGVPGRACRIGGRRRTHRSAGAAPRRQRAHRGRGVDTRLADPLAAASTTTRQGVPSGAQGGNRGNTIRRAWAHDTASDDRTGQDADLGDKLQTDLSEHYSTDAGPAGTAGPKTAAARSSRLRQFDGVVGVV